MLSVHVHALELHSQEPNSVSDPYTFMIHVRFSISVAQCSGNDPYQSVQSELIQYSCGYESVCDINDTDSSLINIIFIMIN